MIEENPPKNASYWKRAAKGKDIEIERLNQQVAIYKEREAALMEQEPVAARYLGSNGYWIVGNIEDTQKAIEYGCEFLYTRPIPAAEGYVLAPVEPTKEMINAAYYVSHDGCKTEGEMITRSYKAMLEAAKGEVK